MGRYGCGLRGIAAFSFVPGVIRAVWGSMGQILDSAPARAGTTPGVPGSYPGNCGILQEGWPLMGKYSGGMDAVSVGIAAFS